MQNKRPVIGIVVKHRAEYNEKRPDSFVRDEVAQAIFDNGGLPIGLLPSETKIALCEDNYWQEQLSEQERQDLIDEINLCDGIILQGGNAADGYEAVVARYCYDLDIPLLAICAGQNNLARAMGGSTYDIPNPEKHWRPDLEYAHDITVDPNSKFYQIVHTTKMPVNSRHIKAIKDCPGLGKVAFCDDGYPDVIEAPDKRFCFGVRFHPESLYRTDQRMNAIFQSFLVNCRNHNG